MTRAFAAIVGWTIGRINHIENNICQSGREWRTRYNLNIFFILERSHAGVWHTRDHIHLTCLQRLDQHISAREYLKDNFVYLRLVAIIIRILAQANKFILFVLKHLKWTG